MHTTKATPNGSQIENSPFEESADLIGLGTLGTAVSGFGAVD